MKARAKNVKLLSILIPALLLAVTGIIITNTVSFLQLTKNLEEQNIAQQQLETDYAMTSIADHLHQIKMEITSISSSTRTLLIEKDKCANNLNTSHYGLEGISKNLFITDTLGNIKGCSESEYEYYLGMNIQNKDYFTTPFTTKKPYVSNILDTGENAHLIISAPIYETKNSNPYPDVSGKFLGIVFSIINFHDLYLQHIHKFVGSKEKYFILYDNYNEKIIYQNLGVEKINKKFFEDDNTRTLINDKEYIKTSSSVVFDNQHWSLTFLTLESYFSTNTRPITTRHFIGLGTTILLLIIVFILMSGLYKSRENIQTELNKAHITLKKLGLQAEVEQDLYTKTDFNLQSKNVYLIKDNTENQVNELFITMLNKGYKGLGLIRENPELFRKKYKIKKTPLVWMSKTKTENITTENDPLVIMKLATDFIKENNPSIILIDRIDFLLQQNTQATIKGLQELKDLVSTKEAIVLLHLPEGVLEKNIQSIIESETVDVLGKEHLLKGISLSEQELSILKFINEGNTTNKLVSYNDITKQFAITKPTTRARINSLQQKHLLTVAQKGRYKTLSISSLGRRMIK